MKKAVHTVNLAVQDGDKWIRANGTSKDGTQAWDMYGKGGGEGQSENAARSVLEQAGFEVDVDEREDEDVDPGTVIDQDPRDESRRLGTTVTIVVATGGDDPSPTPTEEETTLDRRKDVHGSELFICKVLQVEHGECVWIFEPSTK